MSNETENKIPIRPQIKALEIGQSVQFPSERTQVVRNTASQLGLSDHMEFDCNISDDRTVITVTRTA